MRRPLISAAAVVAYVLASSACTTCHGAAADRDAAGSDGRVDASSVVPSADGGVLVDANPNLPKDSGPDGGERRPDDAGRTAPPEPIDAGVPLWFALGDVQNRCAETASLSPESLAQGGGGADAGPDAVIGALQWQDLWLTQGGGNIYNNFDGASMEGEIAGVTVAGRRLVVAANHIFSPNGWYFTGLGVFDVDTHEHLFYHELDATGVGVGPVLVTPDPPRAIQVYKRRFGDGIDHPTIGIGVYVMDLLNGATRQIILTTPDNDPTFKDGATLTSTGALVVLHDARLLISLNPESGEPYWVRPVESIEPEGAGSYLQIYGVWPMDDGAVYIQAIAHDGSSEDHVALRVDACGSVTPLPLPTPAAPAIPPIWFEGGYAMLIRGEGTPTPSLLVHDSEIGSNYIEPVCYNVVSLSGRRFACMYGEVNITPPYQTRYFVSRFNVDGSNRQVIELPANGAPDGGLTWWRYQPLAVSTDAIVYQGENSGTRYVAVVGVDDLSVRQNFALEPTPRPMHGYHDEGVVPLLLDNGKIVLSYKGEIFVYQTSFRGLEAVSHPRGSSLGGNQNRGGIAIPTP